MNEQPFVKGHIRIGGAVILGIAIVAGAFAVRDNTPTESVGAVAVVTAPTRAHIPIEDSDGDGTKDWEEELERSVFQNVYEPIASSTTEPYRGPETFTEEFSEQFFESLFEYKLSGSDRTEYQDDLIGAALSAIRTETEDIYISERHIKTTPDNSLVAMRAYGNIAGALFIGNMHDPEAGNEVDILLEALSSNDPSVLDSLEHIEGHYGILRSETLGLVVPSNLSREHVDLINTYHALERNLAAFRDIFTDPLTATVHIERYQKDMEALRLALKNMHQELSRYGVVYTEEEPGFVFSHF